MVNTFVLTIDAGTSRLKAAIYDLSGNLIGIAGQDMTVLHPFEGACEMDMTAVWDAACSVCGELAQAFPDAWKNLRGVAVTGQGDGMWPLDASGSPLGSAILWNDVRTKQLKLSNEAQLTEFSKDHSLCPLFSGASPLILRWIKEFEPERLQRLCHVLHCKDWLAFKLTGSIVTERTDASTALLNIRTGQYEFELLNLLGLPAELAAAFPPVVDSFSVVGIISPKASTDSGIPAGLPVMAGALDVAAATFGAGARQPGDGVTILGTTFSNQVIVDGSQVSHEDVAGSTLCYPYPDTYMRVLATSNGAAAIEWARAFLAPGMGFAEIEAELARIPVGSEGAFFLPYLNGERAPFRESRAAACFGGLTLRHTPFHMLRAVYEGLAYSLRDCYAHLPSKQEGTIILCGGASASRTLCQACADMLNRSLLRIPDREFGLLGMAAALIETLGYPRPDLNTDTQCELFTPQADAVQIYNEGFEVYKELRRSAFPFWTSRDEFLRRLG